MMVSRISVKPGNRPMWVNPGNTSYNYTTLAGLLMVRVNSRNWDTGPY